MHSKGLKPVYIKLAKDFTVKHEKISVPELYGLNPESDKIYFAFEETFQPFRKFVLGSLPRVDMVIRQIEGDKQNCVTPLEIKLTALPDDQTSSFGEEDFGSEIVVRPDTIVYLALSFVAAAGDSKPFTKHLKKIFENKINWRKSEAVAAILPEMVGSLDRIMAEHPELEVPLMIQPIWKTQGKSTALAENCLDVFVWSNFAMTRLFFNQVEPNGSITRPERTVVWLAMMLNDFVVKGKIDHRSVIDLYTYDTRNDKAFAIGGLRTREYMRCPELIKPRIKREEIRNIITGGGEELLSPERRFDGVVQNAIDLFKK